MVEESSDFRTQLCHVPEFTFPHDLRSPPGLLKFQPFSQVAARIALELLFPILTPGFWYFPDRARFRIMKVPKTSVNKDHLFPAGEYNVGGTWQLAAV
jgi:hypothetical protein